MSKRKAEGALERGIPCEGDTTEVGLVEANLTRQSANVRTDTPAERGYQGGSRHANLSPQPPRGLCND